MGHLVETSWLYRRTVVFATLAFCAWAVGYLTVWGKDTALERDIVSSLSLLAAAVIGSYIGGAAWDDLNRMRHSRFERPPPERAEVYPPPEDGRG